MAENKNPKEIISYNVKKYRKLNNLTQESLAELADVSTTYIANIECGRTWISDKTLEKICSALHIDYYLLFFEENTTKNDLSHNREKKLKMINERQEEFCEYVKKFISDTFVEMMK